LREHPAEHLPSAPILQEQVVVSDHRCVCGRQCDDWEWADHATDEVVDALTTEIGLAAEMGQDLEKPRHNHPLLTDWHEG
jgi:hypothetical protein